MDRQLYGIGSLVGREKFGIGSSLKKFVRNIIPNEVSKVATTVAPFIAPFDPATAAVLSSVGTFDQTGSMSGSLKSGALTYGGGQLARYLGGADFQALPGQSGFTGQSLLSPASYSQGITAALDPRIAKGMTMPTGSKTGFKLAKELPDVQEIPTVAGDVAEAEAERTARIFGTDYPTKEVAKATPGVSDRISKIMKGDDVLGNAFELAKSGVKAAFTNKDGSLDKRAVIAAVAGAASYAEARAAAKDLGVDLTEEEYDEAARTEKLGEYQGYLQDFFKGKKDGGRIPFADGSEDPAPISGDELKKIIEEFMKNQEKEEELRKKYADGTGNMGVVTRGLPEAAYEQEDQSISYMDPKAKEQIFESLATMEPGSRSSIIEFMMKAGKISEDDYNEFIERLQIGVEKEGTRITKQGGGSSYTPEQILKMKRILFQLDDNPDILVMDDENIVQMYMQLAETENRAKGGRIGYKEGKEVNPDLQKVLDNLDMTEEEYRALSIPERAKAVYIDSNAVQLRKAKEKIMDLIRSKKAGGGIMDIPTGQPRMNQQGVKELDYRQEGGFVPIGIKERADDVPAMLSKNEFVMTADAVRGIGNGSVENGAKKLYNMMKEAEKVGRGVA